MISAEHIHSMFVNSLFREDEEVVDPVVAEGLTVRVGFHPGRLEETRESVIEIVEQLSEQFLSTGGGGWTFLQLPFDKEGNQWGEQVNAHELLLLTLALGISEYCAPRPFWSVLPGGLPYVCFRI